MDVTCSLCPVSVKESSKRRKKLHGESCKEVKATLLSIAEDSGVNIAALELNANAYLCYQCNLLLCNIRSTKSKLGKLVSNVKVHLLNCSSTSVDSLGTLTSISDEPSVVSAIPSSGRDPLHPSPAKIPCPAPSSLSPDVLVSYTYI